MSVLLGTNRPQRGMGFGESNVLQETSKRGFIRDFIGDL